VALTFFAFVRIPDDGGGLFRGLPDGVARLLRCIITNPDSTFGYSPTLMCRDLVSAKWCSGVLAAWAIAKIRIQGKSCLVKSSTRPFSVAL